MPYELYIGIDYSGRGEPDRRVPGIQAVEMKPDGSFRRVSPLGDGGRSFNWSRRELHAYLHDLLSQQGRAAIIGIDHNLSFPARYFAQHRLEDWDEFLTHFQRLWNTKEQSVKACRATVPAYPNASELRLTEAYTSSAKSAWNFEQMTGAVSYSAHAGLPWIYELRNAFRDRLHAWPFDGWAPKPGKHVLAEAYPAILYQRYKRFASEFPNDWPRDAQDAFVIAAWLRERDRNGTLARYFLPDTLTEEERRIAERFEGWILGIC